MPDRLITAAATWAEHLTQAAAFILIGILIAVGQLLQSKEIITWRIAIGRCITTGGLALVAGAALATFPDLPFIAQMGIAAALASLGNTGLEMIAQRLLNRGGIE